MLPKEIIAGENGELEYGIKIEEQKLKLILGLDTKGVDAGIYVDFELVYFLDKLKAAIPGELDDTVIDLLKAAALK